MNTTSIIAAALIIGFVIFITMRGELSRKTPPGYLQVLGLA